MPSTRVAPFVSRRVRLWFFVLVALLGPLASCEGEPETGARPAAAQTGSFWYPLGTWSGRGNRQTESFDVRTGALRLTWEARDESAAGTGRLQVSLYSAISGRPLRTIVDRRGAGSDVVQVGSDPRVAYLQIESEQVDWRITLEEGMPGGGEAVTPRP